MPIEKVSTILRDADKGKYGVVAFNAFNYESIAWIIETAQENNVPVIIMLHPVFKKYIPVSTFAAITKDIASKIKINVGLHLDHSNSFTEILGAIKDGFTSVMFDGSALPFEENVKETARVVDAAHAMNIDVEAELGYVGLASKKEDFIDKSRFTKPSDAIKFVELTGVDSLAVAIGSAHGIYVEKPNLDLELLDNINKVLETPLVLHGGTGIPDEQIRQAVKLGINKLNVGTGFIQEFYYKTKDLVFDYKKPGNTIDFSIDVKQEVKKYIMKRIKTVV